MLIEVPILAVALALDATAAAIVRGATAPRIRAADVMKITLLFGGFQAAMPLGGWLLGARLGPLIEAWDHWVAFVLLAILGVNMLRGAMSNEEEEATSTRDPFGWRPLLALSVATSIDALAAGITLPLLGAPLLLSVTVIGTTTCFLSMLGLLLGRRLGRAFGPRLEAVGGVVLVALGLKIVVEHVLL